VLQKIELAGAGFDIILAMPKTPPATCDLAKSPDALVMHLIGGELTLGFDSEEKMLAALESLRMPVCLSPGERGSGGSQPRLRLHRS
jgi:hypothetical protein